MNAVLLAALALGEQIERIGSYFGFAAVIGLGVLALLYFAQAREVKRLREWAGRAPERDLELAQRVQDDAQKRVVAQPVPATAAAGQPGGPQTAAAQQAEAARQAPAAGAQGPPAPGAPAESPAAGPPGRLARPQAPASNPASGAPASGAPGLGSPSADAPASSPSSPTPGPPVPPAPATAGAVAAARQAAKAGRSPAVSNGSAGQDTHESAAARPSPLPDLPSRAPRKAPADAPSEDDPDPPKRRRTGLLAGGVAAVLAAVVVLVLVLSGGDDGAQPAENLIGDAPPASEPEQQPPSSSESSVDRRATDVFVLNGTITTGLAASVARTVEKEGFTILNAADNDIQTLTTTSVYFADGAEAAAQVVADTVGVDAGAVQQMDADSKAKVPTETDVLVITGSDIAAEG